MCEDCAGALYGARPGRVRPEPEPPGLPVVHAAARYEDAPRAVLLAHKERGALELAVPLGTALAGAVRSAVADASATGDGTRGVGVAYPGSGWVHGSAVDAIQELILVPVPSARRSVGARGHDPARRIAGAAAAELRRCGTPARVAPVLRQRRSVGDQAGLGARERLANLSGALGVVPGGHRLLEGGRTVLVDDLMTTGASLVEATRALGVPVPWEQARTASAPRIPSRAAQRPRAPERRPRDRSPWDRSPRDSGGVGLVAAVVAAPPKAFEINWN